MLKIESGSRWFNFQSQDSENIFLDGRDSDFWNLRFNVLSVSAHGTYLEDRLKINIAQNLTFGCS